MSHIVHTKHTQTHRYLVAVKAKDPDGRVKFVDVPMTEGFEAVLRVGR